jgi:hypothetical protein
MLSARATSLASRYLKTHTAGASGMVSVLHTTPVRRLTGMIYDKTNFGFNICHQADVHVVERFGRLSGTQRPGMYVAIPFVDTIRVVRTSEVCLQVPPLRATTEDNVMVDISGAAYVQVRDPIAALYGHVDPFGAVRTHVQVSA